MKLLLENTLYLCLRIYHYLILFRWHIIDDKQKYVFIFIVKNLIYTLL